jgi:hypothetical protein
LKAEEEGGLKKEHQNKNIDPSNKAQRVGRQAAAVAIFLNSKRPILEPDKRQKYQQKQG